MLTCRPATPSDHARLARLIEQDPTWSKSLLPHLPQKNGEILVAESEAGLQGYLALRISNRRQPGLRNRLKNLTCRAMGIPQPDIDKIAQPLRIGLIEDLYVAPAWRRQGIATALVHHAVHRLHSDQVDRTQAIIPANDDVAKEFFDRLGFAPCQLLTGRRMPAQLSSFHRLVRPATRLDLRPLAELVRQEVTHQKALAGYFDLMPRIDWEQIVFERLGRTDTSVLVVEQANRLAGYVEARLVQPGMHSPTARIKATMRRLLRQNKRQRPGYGLIEDIYVLPDFRRQGLATVLLEQGLQWLKCLDVTTVQAAIWHSNEASQRFFLRSGFEPVKMMLIDKRPLPKATNALEAETTP